MGRGSEASDERPYPILENTKTPDRVAFAKRSGKSRHVETEPNPSCIMMIVGASEGGGPNHADSIDRPSNSMTICVMDCLFSGPLAERPISATISQTAYQGGKQCRRRCGLRMELSAGLLCSTWTARWFATRIRIATY